MSDEQPELLKVSEAAALMSLTPKALYLRVERKQIPDACIHREGRNLRFRRDALRAHLGLSPLG